MQWLGRLSASSKSAAAHQLPPYPERQTRGRWLSCTGHTAHLRHHRPACRPLTLPCLPARARASHRPPFGPSRTCTHARDQRSAGGQLHQRLAVCPAGRAITLCGGAACSAAAGASPPSRPFPVATAAAVVRDPQRGAPPRGLAQPQAVALRQPHADEPMARQVVVQGRAEHAACSGSGGQHGKARHRMACLHAQPPPPRRIREVRRCAVWHRNHRAVAQRGVHYSTACTLAVTTCWHGATHDSTQAAIISHTQCAHAGSVPGAPACPHLCTCA